MADDLPSRPARSRLATRLGDRSSRALVWWWRTTWSDEPLDPAQRQLERRLGWGRVVGGVGIAASLWSNPTGVPTWVVGMAVASAVGMFLAGVATLVIAPRSSRPRRLLELLSMAEAVLLSMLLPFGAAQDSPFVMLVLVLLAIVGSVRLGRFGVLRNLAVAAPFETIRLVLAASLFGVRHVEDTVVAVVVAGAVGVLVGDLATTARRGAVRVSESDGVARDHAVRARRRAWESDLVDEVVGIAGTGSADAALVAAVERVRELLDVADVHLLVTAGPDLLVWCSTRSGDTPGSTVTLLPGGPRDRALSLGTLAAATHDDLERIAATGRRHGSMVAAPLPVGGRLLGLLLAETVPGDLLHRRDAVLLGRLGRALAPFLWVAGTTPRDDADGAPDDAQEPAGRPDDERSEFSNLPEERGEASGEEGVDEGVGVERGEVVDALAQADQLHG